MKPPSATHRKHYKTAKTERDVLDLIANGKHAKTRGGRLAIELLKLKFQGKVRGTASNPRYEIRKLTAELNGIPFVSLAEDYERIYGHLLCLAAVDGDYIFFEQLAEALKVLSAGKEVEDPKFAAFVRLLLWRIGDAEPLPSVPEVVAELSKQFEDGIDPHTVRAWVDQIGVTLPAGKVGRPKGSR